MTTTQPAKEMPEPFSSKSPFDMSRRIGEELARVAEAHLGLELGDPMVHRSPPAQEGDFQSSLALRLGKQQGRDPVELARDLAAGMEGSDLVEPPTVSGNGFLNFVLRKESIEEAVANIASDPRLGVPEASSPRRVVIDYSAPNVAKEMHVGHLRSTIIGDAIRKMLEHFGHEVVPQNHLGDWGTPFGMLVEHMLDLGEGGAESQVDDLTRFYRAAREKFDDDPDFAERSRRRVVLLQQGDEPSLAVWRQLLAVSERYFQRIYDLLEVGLTPRDSVGESFYNPMLADVVDELQAADLLVEDAGALCMFLDGYASREGEPMPIIVRKSDGGFNYDTTDLAAIRYRLRDLQAAAVLYVVGAPQALHFEMLFDAAVAAGWAGDGTDLRHVPFGSVLGEDGKMLRTRAGRTVKLTELLEEAIDRARDLLRERVGGGSDGAEELARALGIGAVKYADLSTDRVRDYTFAFERMLSFEGNTAAYLQYAHARVCSLLRKHGDPESAADTPAPISLVAPEERALALQLMAFGTELALATDTLQPHKLTSYLHELVTRFSRFYEQCPIAGSDPEIRASRLALSAATGRTVSTGLALLGISAPERL
jgi:arginyl-tRNA synthetase